MRYLAYGMNCNLENMRWRCPSAFVLGTAILHDYELKFRLHLDIQSSPGAIVTGLLWDINEEDLKELDALEGYPNYYIRKTVTVLHNDKLVDALVYQMVDQSYEAEPHLEYLDRCIQGYTDNGMSIDQLETAFNSALFEETKGKRVEF